MKKDSIIISFSGLTRPSKEGGDPFTPNWIPTFVGMTPGDWTNALLAMTAVRIIEKRKSLTATSSENRCC